MTTNYMDILGSKMSYMETGEGDPILFLHGVPTSSYIWRKLIPHLSSLGRCIAPDLIGFGQSDKPDIEYSVFDHIKYIDAFIEKLQLKNITLIMHGWGSVIGLDYAMRHPENCKGLVFYEPFLRSVDVNEEALPLMEQASAINSNPENAELILNSCFFVDKTFKQDMMHELSDEELEVYRQPFNDKGSGKPILQYLKELPGNNSASDVDALIKEYTEKLKTSTLPKLFLYSVPGFITTIATIMWAKTNLPNIEITEIGEELHFAMEKYPDVMGETISIWLQGIEVVPQQ